MAFWNGRVYRGSEAATLPRRRAAGVRGVVQSLTAPMPGTVLKVLGAPGATVSKGDSLVILEAMKMELPLAALDDALVVAVSLQRGRAGAGRRDLDGVCPAPRHARRRGRAYTMTIFRGRHVTIVEVGPRDGLQNERARVSTADKIAFIDLLSAAQLPSSKCRRSSARSGCRKWPDAAAVFAGITRMPGTRYTALVPNMAGLDSRDVRGRHRDCDLRGRFGNLQPQRTSINHRRLV